MTKLIQGYSSVSEYMEEVKSNPEAIKPDCCPTCHFQTLWSHGSYSRNCIRRDLQKEIDEGITILRFLCVSCNLTFGALPEFLCPRRWYLWCIQEAVISRFLEGHSKAWIASEYQLSRDTVYRWCDWMLENADKYQKTLRACDIQDGLGYELFQFWLFLFRSASLSHFMSVIQRSGVTVP
jgi:hypothetical protein